MDSLLDAIIDYVRDHVDPLKVYDVEDLVNVVKDHIQEYYSPEDIFSKKELIEWYEELDN